MDREALLSQETLQYWMRRCLDLASQGRGRTAPNPMVGAVVFNSAGQFLAEGWHQGAGLPHAEPDALHKVGDAARGGILIVSLEPCCVYGRTPPCTGAILEAGIKRVIVGMVDPDPRMSGKGIALLLSEGIEVQVGVLEEECRRLNRAWLLARKKQRPLISLKAAITLDGRIASAHGESQWITGKESRIGESQF